MMLQIGVLGPLSICQDNGEILVFESSKARALLVYLAVESDRLHSREMLASMFWPDRPDSASLANLRHVLTSLRSTLGERLIDEDGPKNSVFHFSSNTIQFNSSSSVQIDLKEFENNLAAANQEKDLQKRINYMQTAVSLCRGSFMEGFSIKGSPEFEDWLLLIREGISLKLQTALQNLANMHVAAGQWQEALEMLRQLLHLDPWNEAVHRSIMLILAAQDQRSAALAQYERCRKLLLSELGVKPEDETVKLYEQIRAGLYTGQGIKDKYGKSIRAREAPHTTDKPFPSNFVGRVSELAQLQQLFNLALGGQGQIVFITGEAGIGKTSLAVEFIHQQMAQQGDLLIAAGRCNAIIGHEDPYLPFREALQMLLDGDEISSTRILTIEHQRRLTEFLPEIIKALLTAGPDLIDLFVPRETLIKRIDTFGPGGQGLRRKLKEILSWAPAKTSAADVVTRKPQEAMRRMLTELSHLRPLILFLDDLQWADSASISLLHFLSKRLAGSRILIIGAYRPQDIARGLREPNQGTDRHPLDRVRLELQREFGEINLSLDDADGMKFIDALLDREPNCLEKSFRKMFYNQTNGNALFAVELLRSMYRRGHLTQDPSGLWVETEPFDWEKLPARVEAVIAERIGRLLPIHQKLLQAASVEGEIFTAEVVARVLKLDDHQVISWLSGPLGQEQQIVNAMRVERLTPATPASPARLSRYRFNHFLFQKYIYQRIDPVELSELHEAIGTAIETLYGPAANEQALQLAWHYQQGNLLFQAVEYLLAAGKKAVKLSAYDQAIEIYDRCLALIQRLPDSTQRAQLEVQTQLARQVPIFITNGWGSVEATKAVNRVIQLNELLDGKSLDSSILLALYFQVDNFTAQTHMKEALSRTEVILHLVDSSTEPVYRLLGYAMAGQVYLFAGQIPLAAEFLEKAIALYRMQDQEFLAESLGYNIMHFCLAWYAMAQWALGYPHRARMTSDEVIKQARLQAHPFYLPITCAVAGALFYAFQNEPEQARAYAEETLELAKRNTENISRLLSETVLGWAMAMQGEIETGLDLLYKVVNASGMSGLPVLQPFAYMFLADALSMGGRTEEALTLVMNVLEVIERTGRRALEAHALWLCGEILFREKCRTGQSYKSDLSPAACFERSIEIAHVQQTRSLELRAITGLAKLLKYQGQPGNVIHQLEEIISQFDGLGETADLRAARELLAALRLSR